MSCLAEMSLLLQESVWKYRLKDRKPQRIVILYNMFLKIMDNLMRVVTILAIMAVTAVAVLVEIFL